MHIEPRTFAGTWRDAVAGVPDRPFLIWEDAHERVTVWTYGEFDALVARVAASLRHHGVSRGRAVHLVLRNSPAFVATWLAASQLGAWVVPSDPQATGVELDGHIARTNPVVAICAADRMDVYRAAESGDITVLPVAEDDCELSAFGADPLAWTDLPLPEARDRAAVMFTSGTTSAPKGVVVTQANYAFAGDVMAAAAALTTDARQFVALPLFHANAQYYSFAPAISVGASVALMSGFSASRFLTQAARHKATHASLFAAPMRMILARGATPVPGLALRHCWYAQNVTSEQYEELARLLGCRPRQLYGMTETIPAVLTNRPLRPVPGAMGHPTLGCHVEIAGLDGERSADPGTVGEIVVGGEPGVSLFAEYLDDPTTTQEAFRAGLFRTGDLAWRDEAGRFYFAGRQGDVLKVAGENVSLVEIEAVLAQHPSVLEAAAVGEPDAIRDEVPVAYVVQMPGQAPLSAEDLNSFCGERLAPSKRPRAFYIVDELPRTSVGKIRKFLLRTGRA